MTKKITLADIAAEVGVSNVAVHKALTDKPGVSREMREKIKTQAAEMGYQNTMSRRREAEKKKTGNIGVIMLEQYYGYSVSFYGQLYEKVVKILFKYGYYGILELLSAKDEMSGKLPKVLLEQKVDGLILLGQLRGEYIDMMIKQTQLPVFFLDTYDSSRVLDTVISDGYYGMYTLTNYLISQGHTKIGFVGSVDATSSISDRYWGYRRALRENHIEYHQEWEIPDRDEYGSSFEVIMTEPGEFHAFACNCDWVASILIKNLEDHGYSVPQDVSVVGFDNFLPALPNMDANRITSFEVDMERMADSCVKSLIKKMSGKKYTEGLQIVSGKIVYKDTVRKRDGDMDSHPVSEA